MQNRLWITIFMAGVLLTGLVPAATAQRSESFAGQDLHLTAPNMTIYESPDMAEDEHILVFEGTFSMSVGDNQLSSDGAVVWLKTISSDYRGAIRIDYNAQVYLQGNVAVKQGRGARTTDLSQIVVERGEALVARFLVTGEIFATADQQNIASVPELENLPIYQNAVAAIKPIRHKPTIAEEAIAPKFEEPRPEPIVEPKKPWRITDIFKMKPPPPPGKPEPEEPVAEEPKFEYPVNIVALWEAPEFEDTLMPDGTKVSTVIGRFYLWQKRDEKGSLLELQADSAVIFHGGQQYQFDTDKRTESVLASGSVQAVYLKGNILMTEGGRTIRANELYYDFPKHQALAVNAEMRNFEPERGIPIYLRAVKLRQASENVFNADEVTLTTSEFYMPQVSLNASRAILIDTTGIDARTEKKVEKSSYDATLYDVRMKLNRNTVFYWPKLRTNLEQPDIPIKSAHVGHDSEFGTSVETRWHLSRLLGLKEPSGVDSTLALDYFGKRGVGAGVDIDYRQQDYFGNVIAYVLKDRGTDDLGRASYRRNQDAGEDIRGRFRFRHRHYLPYDWQATIETSYASDENFLEWFYRSEFNVGKKQETLLHLKRLKDNWAFSFLGKFRINDFQEMTEELPTVEFHLKGASFWNHKLTYYSDTQISRFRDRLPSDSTLPDPQQFYTFASTRHEVDMPFMWNTVKIVPFVAGTYGFEDQTGFNTNLDGTQVGREDSVWLGEAGIRAATMFWKENQFVKSRLWDLNGIRHIVKPHLEAVFYHDSDETIEMRDIVNFGVSQRWQTRRGPKDNLRSLDWMRLDIDATWLKDSADSARPPIVGSTLPYGPAKFIWNDPAMPVLMRRSDRWFGLLRNSVNADYTWRLSDTTTVLADMNYDIKSSIVQQLNVGVSRYVYPDISYYIGNRYLRPVIVDIADDDIHEKGSSSFVMAATYTLNPKYTAIFAQEYNFDYGKNVKSELTILRRYHRMYYGFTFAMDDSLKRKSVVFSIWPQGVRELAMGRRKYVGLVGSLSED
jgi:hypothetical protein